MVYTIPGSSPASRVRRTFLLLSVLLNNNGNSPFCVKELKETGIVVEKQRKRIPKSSSFPLKKDYLRQAVSTVNIDLTLDLFGYFVYSHDEIFRNGFSCLSKDISVRNLELVDFLTDFYPFKLTDVPKTPKDPFYIVFELFEFAITIGHLGALQNFLEKGLFSDEILERFKNYAITYNRLDSYKILMQHTQTLPFEQIYLAILKKRYRFLDYMFESFELLEIFDFILEKVNKLSSASDQEKMFKYFEKKDSEIYLKTFLASCKREEGCTIVDETCYPIKIRCV
jgi:hypothetical protein